MGNGKEKRSIRQFYRHVKEMVIFSDERCENIILQIFSIFIDLMEH